MPKKYNKVILNDEPLTLEIEYIEEKEYKVYYKGRCFVGHLEDPIDFNYVMLIVTKDIIKTISKLIYKSRLAKSKKDVNKIVEYTKSNYNINIENVHSLGSTEEINNKYLKSLIPNIKIKRQKEESYKDEIKFSYKCYAGCDYKDMRNPSNIIIHESAKSSWKCLMDVTNNPEYVIIIKEYKNDK